MLSLPHLPSPPYFFNKVPEVSVKGGGQGQAGQLHSCSPALLRGLGQPGGVAAIKVGAERRTRMFPLVPVGTDPDLHPSRLQTGGQDRGGGKTDWGCLLGAPAWTPKLAALSARFLLFGYAKQAANSPRAATQRRELWLPQAGCGRCGEGRGLGLGRAVPRSAFPVKGMGNDQGCCFWQGDRVTLQITPWGRGGG